MDEVAKLAGVSKQTVYTHFQNKDRLFSAVITYVLRQYYPESLLNAPGPHTIEEDLRTIGRQYMRLVMSAEAISMYCALVTAAASDPHFSHLFFEAGPVPLEEDIIRFLQQAVSEGKLKDGDMHQAASHFGSLLRGEIHFKQSLGLIDTVSDAEIETHLNSCVEAFLAIYGR